jgi:peptide/nickel transport system ATP-binding protein
MTILSVENLSVEYVAENSSTEALRNISISVESNEILGIVGESGSGKSTLIKSIMRILSAPGLITSGEVLFNSNDILEMTDEEILEIRWKEISLVKQKALNSLNPVSKIGHQIALPYRFHMGMNKSESEKKARHLLDLVSIDQIYFDSYPHELSGGMRQRVIIAMAMALEPKLIIMDEPTTALDVITEHEIIDSIRSLQKELNFSIIFITHDLNLLLQFADRVCVLYDGEVVDYGTTDAIKSGGNHAYTKTLLDAIPRIDFSAKPDLHNKNNLDKILSLDSIHVKYQLGSWMIPEILHAVNDVSLDLYSSHITSIIGESGSGKSTIAKVITGLENLDQGKLTQYNDGHEYEVVHDIEFRKNVQMIFQDPFSALNPIHSVLHHFERPLLRFGISSEKDIKSKACELLEMVELNPAEDFLSKFPHEMSGGECQRVCIARALCSNPKLIIADEPTSMLDVSIRSDILNLFIKLKENFNLSILLITHDIASASICSDEIVVLKEGRVVESGATLDIIQNPTHDYTKNLLKSSRDDWFTKHDKER